MAVIAKTRRPNLARFIAQTKPEFIKLAVNLHLYGMSKDAILDLVDRAIDE